MCRLLIAIVTIWATLLAGPALADESPLPGLYLKHGESFIFKVIDGQPAEVRSANADERPQSGEVSASLSADGSMLQVVSAADTSLNYQAFIARGATDKGQRTSVCTLLPGVMAMESWPGGLPGIRIVNFKPAGDGMTCQ